jgi:hypothetical protein
MSVRRGAAARYAAVGRTTKIALVLLASCFGSLLVAATAALVLAAGGHGWNSTIVSASSILTGPAGAVAWVLQAGLARKQTAAATIAANVLIDLALIVLTVREGLVYVVDTWAHLWPIVLAWAALWLVLQAVPLIAFRQELRGSQ